MLAMRALSSMRRVESSVLHTSRSGSAAASLVKRCGESKRCIIWSMVGASRLRAAPRSQSLLGGARVPRLRQRAWPLAAVPRAARSLPGRRKIRSEFCHRWCMLRRMANPSSKVALAVMRCVAGVKSPVAQLASVPQPNHSVKRTAPGVPVSAAYLKRWACRNTVRAMQSAEHLPTVEHVNRFTGTVGSGRPSFGGRRTVGSHRRAAAACRSLRRAVLIGCKPSRGGASTRQVSALVIQATARFSPRPAQPCVQADGPKAAAA
jgi:hypothetical protein